MKCTIEIDDDILTEVQKETGKKTPKGAVMKAMREFLETERRRREIRDLKHSVKMK